MSPRIKLISLLLLPAMLIAGLVLFANGEGLRGKGAGFILRTDLPGYEAGVALPDISGDAELPLVVIDPGHGGVDPGATSGGYVEKELVLALAKALRDELESQDIARVALTRDGDKYLLHNERYRIAQRLDADLFLSIHADSAGEIADVAGASIYTLSNEASSRAAALYAARENASDTIGGVDLSKESDSVTNILVELSQRRTQERSDQFARLIEQEGQGVIQFHPQARRSAWLAVLRAPDIPSVLFESGFISNSQDAERLASPEGQKRFAETMARAIGIFFVRQSES